MPIVCKRLLIANVVVFVLQIMITRPLGPPDFAQRLENLPQILESMPTESMTQEQIEQYEMMQSAAIDLIPPRVSVVQEWCELDPTKVAHGQVWRLITSAFCHDRYMIWHLLINMIFLYWFGTRLEQMYGSREFALFYFTAAVCASVAFLALNWYTGDMTPAIGASGAVWGLIALYAIHHPYETVRVYLLFPIQIRWLALLYLLLDLHPVLLALNGDGNPDGVAHAAHLGGAAFGFLYFKYDWRLERYWNRLPVVGKEEKWQNRRVKRPARSTIKLHQPETGGLRVYSEPIDPQTKRMEIDLDRVLEKISEQGRESLTDEEIAVLESASKRYRER
ncbi:Rhomboid protease GluP [Stieleria varia]|uniref:Rhomboid protease GluP n=2 Tax=Stieleria varia TaxID=2528005 RepID=A0A5C6AQ97_9BACT|nr:Rhomboid protease GluP [Stieleria varia]